MAASLLADGPVEIAGVPVLRDISTFGKLLGILGAEVSRSLDATGRETMRIVPGPAEKAEAPYELVKTMRASVLVLGPLLARYGRARISLPGGCAIGARPIDQHLRGLELLGAKTALAEGYIEATADRLKGAPVRFDMKTVTGTENLMMAAALAEGTTVLSNAAHEPEVCDLARLLRAMGADIEGDGTDEIVVRGVRSLRGARHEVMADRIEAATLLRRGRDHGRRRDRRGGGSLAGWARCWTSCGKAAPSVSEVPGGVRVTRTGPIRSVNVKTAPYPGFPTDMQAQFMAYMCLGDGFSVISETIFENRFMHVAELRRMGAQHRRVREHRGGEGRAEAVGRAADGHGPARLGVPRAGGTGRGRDHGSAPDLPSRPGIRHAGEQASLPGRRYRAGQGIGGERMRWVRSGTAGFREALSRASLRGATEGAKVSPVVSEIIARIREEGDAALAGYTRKFDRFDPARQGVRRLPERDRRGLGARLPGAEKARSSSRRNGSPISTGGRSRRGTGSPFPARRSGSGSTRSPGRASTCRAARPRIPPPC